MKVLFLCVFILVALSLYVRFAPTRIDDWHNCDAALRSVGMSGDGRYTIQKNDVGPAELDEISDRIRATPRTRRLAGSFDAGCVTYVTRSLFWGFPDYTTLVWRDGTLTAFARLRFGRSDFGVNRKRVTFWLTGT